MAYSSWMAAANNIPEPEPVEPERGGFVSQTVSRPQGVVRTGAASSGSLLGDVARIGRRVVPQGVRDTLGSAARATFAELQSGEALGNEMVPKYKGKPIGGFTPGTDIGEQIGRIPRVGRVLRTAADIAGAPATWGTAGIGPGAQASFKALPLAARVPLNIAAPASRSANFGVRLGAETAIGTAATVGAQETAKRTDNPWLVAGAGLGAGVLASGAVTAAPRTMRAAAKGATTYRDLTENIPVGMSIRALKDEPTVTLYRGDAKATGNLSLGKTDTNALFGQGVYATDSPRVANDYQAKGAANLAEYRGTGRNAPVKTITDTYEKFIEDKSRELAKYKFNISTESFDGTVGRIPNEIATWRLNPTTDRFLALARQEAERLYPRASLNIRKQVDGRFVVRTAETAKAGVRTGLRMPQSVIARTLDAEAPLPPGVADALADTLADGFGDGVTRSVVGVRAAGRIRGLAEARPDLGWEPTYRNLYEAAVQESDDILSQELQISLRRRLGDLGYTGIRYQGGARGGAGHNAYVFWDEQAIQRLQRGEQVKRPRMAGGSGDEPIPGIPAASPGPLLPGEASPRAMLIPGVGDVPPLSRAEQMAQARADFAKRTGRQPEGTTLQARFIPGLSPSSSTGAVLGAAGGYGSSDEDATGAEKFRNVLIGAGLGAAGGAAVGKRFPALNQGVKGKGDVLGGYVVPPSGPGKGASVTPLDSARTKILDATKREAQLRNSGVVDLEIGSGRTKQAAGIRAGVEGATGSEAIARARAGARVGQLRTILAEPIDLDEDEIGAILSETMRRQPGRDFSILQVGDIIDRLREGRGLQPAQIETVRDVLGKDVADSLSLRPASAEPRNITPAMIRKAQADLAAEVEAGPEAAARRQTAANAREVNARMRELGEKAPPPPKPSDSTLDLAALDPDAKWNADRATAIRRARKQVDAWRSGQASLREQAQRSLQQQADETVRMERQSARNIAADELRTMRAELRASRQADAEAGRVTRRGMAEDRIVSSRNASDSALRDEARRVLADNPAALEDFEYSIKANRAILDEIGETAHTKIANVSAFLSGNMADSYLTALEHRRLVLEGLMEQRGVSPETMRKVGGLFRDAELKRRYPNGVPPRLASELEKTKALGDGAGDIILKGAAAASGEMKKAAFWADFGIMGQAGLSAATTPLNLLTGMVNRAASMAHGGVDTALGGAGRANKRIQYARDGLGIWGKVGSSLEQESDGWILRGIPGLKGLDAKIAAGIDWTTRLQYDTVMGELAILKHEGNLVQMKIAGMDITNARVRATSAAMANAEVMKAFRALSTRRATVERATVLSPTMRRAQVTHVLQLARTLDPRPGVTKEQRFLGAMGILSATVGTLAIGKVLNDAIGIGDFIFDPSMTGYGQIVTKDKDAQGRNRIISMIPQQQVVTANAKAIRALAESDPEMAAKEWAKLGMGTSSQSLQIVEKAMGFGYEPGAGYQFGGYGKSLTTARRIAAALPIPPIAQGPIMGQPKDLTGSALDFGGLTNFPESPTAGMKRDPQGYYRTLKGEAQLEAVKPEAWRMLLADAKAPPEVKQYPSYYEWSEAERARLRPLAESEAAGMNPRPTPGEVEAAIQRGIDRNPIAKANDRARTALKNQWVEANPARALENYDRYMAMSPDQQRDNYELSLTQEQRAAAHKVLGR